MGRNRTRKERKQAKHRRQSQDTTANESGSRETTDGPYHADAGIGGEASLFASRRRVRGDARLVSKLISCGVIPEDRAGQLIQLASGLAVHEAQQKHSRNFASLLRTMVSCAKLEIDYLSALGRALPAQPLAGQPPQRSDEATVEQHDLEDLPEAFIEQVDVHGMADTIARMREYDLDQRVIEYSKSQTVEPDDHPKNE